MALTKVTTHVLADDIALSGNPTTSTQSASDNSTKIATTAYVTTAVSNLVDGAPSTLNTLNEIAAALNDDAALNTTLTNSIATKLPLAGGTMTGTLKTPNLTINDGVQEFDKPNVKGFRFLHNDAGNDLSIQQGDTNNANYVTKLNISTDGKVGIGTNSPVRPLHLSTTTGGSIIHLTDNSTGHTATDGVDIQQEGTLFQILNREAGDIRFGTSAAERMRIDSSGNVGIGTTTPGNSHAKVNNLVVGSGSAGGMSVYNGTAEGWYAFSRDNANNTDAYDGGMSYTDRVLKFHVNSGATRMTIDGQGKVGIGTTSPGHKLSFGTHIPSDGKTITVYENGNVASGIGVVSGVYRNFTDETSVLSFGHYAHSDGTTYSERMRIDASGKVGIGTAGPDTKLHLSDGAGGAIIRIERNDNTISDGNVYGGIEFEGQDASAASAAGVRGKILGKAEGATGEMAITFETAAGYSASTERMRIQSGGGISFNGDAATANALDDYEEGTWTPTFANTNSTATGTYTKIGNQVTVHFRVISSGGLPSGASQVQVGNLPFTIGTNFGGVGGLYVGPSDVTSATGGGGTIVPYVTGGETVIRFLNVDTGTFGYTIWGELEVSHNNVITAIGTVTYQV